MKQYKIFLFFIFSIFSIVGIVSMVNAQTADELRNKISERGDTIQKLEAEIKQYQIEIDAIGKEKDSLGNTIKSLDISKKKLEADTKITENKIANKNLEIKELSLRIGDKSERIGDSREVITKSLYNISQLNSASVIETILGKKSFSDLWDGENQLATLQGSMQNRIKELEDLKVDLESNKKLTEKKKAELVKLTNDLKNQAKIIAGTVKEKNSILAETKNTEASYKQLLIKRQKEKEAYEKEVSALESALKIIIDPKSIPTAGTSVLRYPVETVRITQYFGNTTFSTKNPLVYRGSNGEHNGVDFGASIGTPILAAAGGTITNVINPSLNKRCGYGKWITVRHPNGLTTLYSHLSLPTATIGDTVYAGQVIGYSGNTGFVTGPHLHFGVYVTQGLKTIESKSCPGIIIPYAPYEAYLNPLSYL